MREYVRGAFEALSWVRELLTSDLSRKQIIEEVDAALGDIREGVATDFRYRLTVRH